MAWWMWWRFPAWQAERLRHQDPSAMDRADLEAKIRKTVGQFMGGVAVLASLVIAFLQFQTTREADQDTREAVQNLQISRQSAQGFRDLGDKSLVIRLGGIYALERVAKDSPENHWPIMEALTAYVRETTRGAPKDKPVAADIQAILTVIGRRDTAHPEQGAIDLNGARLSGADLSEAVLLRANLIGADLRDADLRDADLRGADLSGEAVLPRADLGGADLRKADLSDAFLRDADLRGADLREADLREAVLLRADLGGADLREAHLDEANFNTAYLSGADLGGAYLSGADLRGARELYQEQLDEACGDDETKLPEGLTIPHCK